MNVRRASVWLGFSTAVGLMLALAVAAFARETASGPTKQFVVVPGDSPSPAPLGVFSEPRDANDVLPTELAVRVASLSGGPELPEAVRNGTLELEKSRLLLTDVGSAHSNLYVLPSSKGRVCYVLTAGSESCQGRFTRELPVGIAVSDPDGFDSGISTTIMGLAPNNVVAVDILIGGQSYSATLRNDAYFFESPRNTAEPEGLRVTFRSGRVTTITLPALLPGR